MKSYRFLIGHGVGGSLRVDAGLMQGFVRVDIAYPRHSALVQKPRSDRRSRAGEVRL